MVKTSFEKLSYVNISISYPSLNVSITSSCLSGMASQISQFMGHQLSHRDCLSEYLWTTLRQVASPSFVAGFDFRRSVCHFCVLIALMLTLPVAFILLSSGIYVNCLRTRTMPTITSSACNTGPWYVCLSICWI